VVYADGAVAVRRSADRYLRFALEDAPLAAAAPDGAE
jgi:hypothetical protein